MRQAVKKNLLAVVVAAQLAACGGGGADEPPEQQPPPLPQAASPPEPVVVPVVVQPEPVQTPPPMANLPSPPPTFPSLPPPPPVQVIPPAPSQPVEVQPEPTIPTPIPQPVAVAVEPEPVVSLPGYQGQWVGAFERTSLATGQVLGHRDAVCWYGLNESLGRFRIACMLFNLGQPVAVLDTGDDDDGFGSAGQSFMAVGKVFAFQPGDGLSPESVADFNSEALPPSVEPRSQVTWAIRVGPNAWDWKFEGTRPQAVSDSMYGVYRSVMFNGEVSSLNLTRAADPVLQPSTLFIQGRSCVVQGEHRTHYRYRTDVFQRPFDGAMINGTVQCGGQNTQSGFAFFGRPAFVDGQGAGMLFFAFTGGGPARFGYALK